MPAPAGKVPIIASAQAGFGFLQARWRALLPVILGGTGVVILVAGLSGSVAQAPGLVVLSLTLDVLVFAVAYAAMLAIALKPAGAVRQGFANDAARLISAMAIVSFFLALVMVVAFLACGVVLSTMLSPYEAEIAAANGDPAVMNALLEQLMRENPTPFYLIATIILLAWYGLTSRLYLAAPATIAEGRVRTLETWAWTKGALVRITAARILLLAPGMFALALAQQAMLSWAQTPGAAGPLAALMVIGFMLAVFVLLALEAGLSAFLYRGLRPPNA